MQETSTATASGSGDLGQANTGQANTVSGPNKRERRTREAHLGLLVLLFFVVFFSLAPSYLQFMHNNDAGSQLSKGQQILFGFHPWAHVHSSVYGPAIFYLSALAQALSGGRLLPEIMVIFAGYLASYLLFFSTFSARTDRRGLLLIFAVIVLAAFPPFHKYHVLLPQAVFLYGLHHALLVSVPGKSALRLSVACAVAGAFRIDFGVYGLISSVLFLLLRNASSGVRTVSKALAIFLATGLLLAGPWLLFLASTADLGEIAVTSYHMTRGLIDGLSSPLPPYRPELPPLNQNNSLVLLYRFFHLAPWGILAVVFLRYRRSVSADRDFRWAKEPTDLYLLVAAVFAVLVNLQASHRIDLSHLKQSLPSSLLALFLALAHWWPRMSSMRMAGRSASLAGAVLLTGFLGFGLAHRNLIPGEAYSVTRWRDTMSSWMLTRSEALEEEATGAGDSPLPEILRRVRRLTAREDAVLFIPYLGQAYYFAERHFATAFGWLHPGRFRKAGSQQRFIDAMHTTRLIVDQPSFAFDRMPERNARAYAPRVMRHIYSTYGLFDVIGGFVFLSREPQIWEQQGQYALDLLAWEAPVDAQGGRCGSSGYEIHQINTLPATAWGGNVSIPHGAGLLITARDRRESARSGPGCPAVGLLAESGVIFVVARGGRPVLLPKLGRRSLIDTRTVPPGKYRLVQLPCSASQVPNPAPDSVCHEAGITITLREPPEPPGH